MVPTIFVSITDPVGQGFVQSLARPGGNATGFTLYEFSMGTKWLEILRELVPSSKKCWIHVQPSYGTLFRAIFSFDREGGRTFGIEPHLMPVDDESAVLGTLAEATAG